MAFDSISLLVLASPTITSNLNDWNGVLNVPSIEVKGSINDYAVVYSLPTINLVGSFEFTNAYSLSQQLAYPQVVATLDSEALFLSNIIIQKPIVSFSVEIPNQYLFSTTTPRIVFSASFDSTPSYVFSYTIRKPVTNFVAVFSGLQSKQTWVFNTITTAHSRYRNYEFNSFFKLGAKQFIVSSDGIFEVTGDRDAVTTISQGTEIAAEIVFPTSNFGDQTMKSCSDAIIYGRTNGDMEVCVVLDEEQERTGFIINSDDRNGMHRKRTKIPKGLVGNSWQFKLKNVNGSSFDLNAFEVPLKSLQRIKW